MTKNTILKTAVIFFALLFVNCDGDVNSASYGVTATGIIKQQGLSTYMYGTHVLLDDGGKTLYALKSDTMRLDDYLNKKVSVKGDLVSGYPVDGGPDFLNVKAVE